MEAAEALPHGRHGHGDRLAEPRAGVHGRTGRVARRARSRRGAAPVGAHDPRSCPSVRAAAAMPRRRVHPRVRRGRRCEGARRLSTTGCRLLRAMDELGHPFTEIGVPSYPEGHVDIPRARLLEVLKEKQRYAKYMATQMSFNPGAILRWLGQMRAQGVMLPVHLGTPGVAELTKLHDDQHADRHRRQRALPEEEPTHGGLAADAGQVRSRRVARRHGAGAHRPGARTSKRCTCSPSTRCRRTVDWQARMLAALDE